MARLSAGGDVLDIQPYAFADSCDLALRQQMILGILLWPGLWHRHVAKAVGNS